MVVQKSKASVFRVQERHDQIELAKNSFFASNEVRNFTGEDIKTLEKYSLTKFERVLIKIITFLRVVVRLENVRLNNLIETDQDVKHVFNFYRKIKKLNPHTIDTRSRFVFVAGKLNTLATEYQFKTMKAKSYTQELEQLNQFLTDPHGHTLPDLESFFTTQPKKLKQLIQNIAEIYSNDRPAETKRIVSNVQTLLSEVVKMKNANGQNIIQQLSILYTQKSEFYEDLSSLQIIKEKIQKKLSINPEDINGSRDIKGLRDTKGLSQKTINQLDIKDLSQINVEMLAKKIPIVMGKISENIGKIDSSLKDFLNLIHDKLSAYEVSVDRLTEQFPADILTKPVDVTMVAVEFTGLIKEGGLGEAVEGLAKAMKKQHPDNKVRLIFPKFSNLPAAILKELDNVQPRIYANSHGKPFKVYTFEYQGIDCRFIEDNSFVLKGEKPSIYGPEDDVTKNRFATFSGLAADYLMHVKTDYVHLHDWHVGGVALALKSKYASKDTNDKRPRIVMTYHNNGLAAQGEYRSSIYNYSPSIQGLVNAGIASQGTNVFVEMIRASDAVTTVSEKFAVESQRLASGAGVSYPVREAAEQGRLTGIINGSNPHSFNPKADVQLKNWKDPVTGDPIDLTYGSEDSSLKIMETKRECKLQLQKWLANSDIAANAHAATMDFDKPIVTYLGRFDTSQKGLDKFEEAIEATLQNGGQFVVMGILPDDEATRILDDLQIKYKDKPVYFIRDYKEVKGGFHYQSGDKETGRQGCGSLVRAASDFVYVPSKFEPCGLVQFESWLFGSLAIGSNVGGLADTIITQEKNAENYNGFLFERDDTGDKSAFNVVGKAINTWKSYTLEEQGDIARSLIEEGKQYSWSTSPYGLSPVEKYRYVYENAGLHADRAENAGLQFVNILSAVDKIRGNEIQKTPDRDFRLKDEYFQSFYEGMKLKKGIKFKEMEKKYLELPEWIRTTVPSPYGLKLDFNVYEKLGAHIEEDGVRFAVEAPNAKEVKLAIIADDGSNQIYDMVKSTKGRWNSFVPELKAGANYQFVINDVVKIDPCGFSHTFNPDPSKPPCSVVVDRDFDWHDQEWASSRIEKVGKPSPTSVYEVHPLFWKKNNGEYLNYREFAKQLIDHCKNAGYSHVELMGILEHPHPDSWGYQVTGFFAPNSRMGNVDDFKYLVNELHKAKIGVILDWVPAHFATDNYSLADFDGTNQYQPSKLAVLTSIRNLVFRWGTHFFDYKKNVREFLTSSAMYWIKEMHIDGLRVDAVRSMLLSNDVKSSRRFLKELNETVHREAPGVEMIAEDYSSTMETAQSVSVGGLGFDRKWNVGWMKNSLDYFSKDIQDRPRNYNTIVNAVSGDTFHRMVLPVSHDDVQEKFKTLLEKNPNLSNEEKFANLRAFFGFMMSVPGQKLMFMGNDVGSDTPWTQYINNADGVMSKKLSSRNEESLLTFKKLNEIYKLRPFWQHNDNGNDVTWIEKDDPKRRIHAFRRTSDEGESVACIHNFSDKAVKFSVLYENKEVLNKLKEMTKAWKNNNEAKLKGNNKNRKLNYIQKSNLSFLSRYPNFVQKLERSGKLQNDLFEWIIVEQKPIDDFLKKQGFNDLTMKPQEIFNSDSAEFGGNDRLNSNFEPILNDKTGFIIGYKVNIPPMSNIFVSENLQNSI